MPDVIVPPVPVLPASQTPEQLDAYYSQVRTYNDAVLEPLRVQALKDQATAALQQVAASTAQTAALTANTATTQKLLEMPPPPPPAPRKFTLAEIALARVASMPESTAATEASMVKSAKAIADAMKAQFPNDVV